jgi:hypothetical protein
MQVTTLPLVKPTVLNCNLNATLELLSRHAPDAHNPAFAIGIQRFMASWAHLHQHRIECSIESNIESNNRQTDGQTLSGMPFAVQDDYGRTCPMHTQRFTDTLEVLARNWQKYQGFSEQELMVLMRKFEITSFAEFDFGEPLLISKLPMAAD